MPRRRCRRSPRGFWLNIRLMVVCEIGILIQANPLGRTEEQTIKGNSLRAGLLIRGYWWLISSAAESAGEGIGGVPVQVMPRAVVAAGGAGVGVPGEVLHVPERNPRIQGGGDRGYLPWILRSAWWEAVLAVEARGSREVRSVSYTH